MNDVPHQWIMDRFTALVLMGELDKQEAERLYALFVQRFPDEVADMKKELRSLQEEVYDAGPVGPDWRHPLRLEQQGDNYITESAKEWRLNTSDPDSQTRKESDDA